MALCGDCEHKRKLRQTTYFECKKYNEILTTNPAEKYLKCLAEDNRPKPKSKNKKDFIEVK